jgi:hypothetical protein
MKTGYKGLFAQYYTVFILMKKIPLFEYEYEEKTVN